MPLELNPQVECRCLLCARELSTIVSHTSAAGAPPGRLDSRLPQLLDDQGHAAIILQKVHRGNSERAGLAELSRRRTLFRPLPSPTADVAAASVAASVVASVAASAAASAVPPVAAPATPPVAAAATVPVAGGAAAASTPLPPASLAAPRRCTTPPPTPTALCRPWPWRGQRPSRGPMGRWRCVMREETVVGQPSSRRIFAFRWWPSQ